MYTPKTFFPIGKIKLGMAAAVMAVFGMAMAPSAHATPISFYNDASSTTTLRFTLGCGTSATASCTGLLEAVFDDGPPVIWSDSTGDLFDLSNSNPVTETAFVNGMLGTSLSTGTQHPRPGSNKEELDFFTSADYFLIKIGTDPNYALFHNLDGNLHLYFKATAKTGSGFSHYTTFGGDPTVTVPEPSSLGLLGLGLMVVLGLITWVPRRRGTHRD